MGELNCIDYKIAMVLAASDLPFSSLLAAAMARADSRNMAVLKSGFPQLAEDLLLRYDAPGGVLPRDMKDSRVEQDVLCDRAAEIAKDYLKRIPR